MISEELISRSPLRILEKSTQGGLGKGNIGIIAARKGVGKTACLVHIATDQLMQDKHIIHVSFAAETGHIVKWYDEIYRELARTGGIQNADDIYEKIKRKRVIMNFKQGGDTIEKALCGLRSMIKEAQFNADIVVIDGYDFAQSSIEEFKAFKRLAGELQISIWFSASMHRDDPEKDDKGVPLVLSQYMSDTSILILLDPHEKFVHLQLVKDHDIFPSSDSLHLKLDPRSMLIAVTAAKK